jgi:MFS family permease
VALTIGVAMIIVDATIVNVAIPSIIRDLHIGITQAEWANSIYSLVFAALLISVGRIGDVTGRRRVFIWGLLTTGQCGNERRDHLDVIGVVVEDGERR